MDTAPLEEAALFFPPPTPADALSPGRPLHTVTRGELIDSLHLLKADTTPYFDAILPGILERASRQLTYGRPRLAIPRDVDAPYEGYNIVLMLPHDCDRPAVVATDADGEVVGVANFRTGLVVHELHRGRGIAQEMMLVAYATGVKDVDVSFPVSPGGLATMCRVHHLAVSRALRDGLEVAPEVLVEYPELQPAPVPFTLGSVV